MLREAHEINENGIIIGTAQVLQTPTLPLTARDLDGGTRAMSHFTFPADDRLNGWRTGTNQRALDHAYFDAIDTDTKAYWLGFLAADAGLGRSGKQRKCYNISISLQEGDVDHLRRLRKALGSEHKIGYNTDLAAVRFSIVSEHMFKALNYHGVHERKSLTIRFPDTIPDSLIPAYVRGFFDGNGSIAWSKRKQPHWRPSPLWRLVSTEYFLLSVRDILESDLGLRPTKLITQNSVFCLSYGGSRTVATIRDWMYDGATVWLPRKRDGFNPPGGAPC